MSHAGRRAVAKHAERLPAFDSLPEAQAALFGLRDDRLALLARLAQAADKFDPNYRPDSLKALEQWYFNLAESDGFARLGVGPEVFEECVAMYFFEIATRHADVEWTVQEYAFGPGLYEIGVARSGFMMFGRRRRPRAFERQNKRKQSMWRDYRRYFGQEPGG